MASQFLSIICFVTSFEVWLQSEQRVDHFEITTFVTFTRNWVELEQLESSLP